MKIEKKLSDSNIFRSTSVIGLKASGHSVIKRISREDVRLTYKFGSLLGEGSFGTVRLAHKTSNPEKKFAIKSILRTIVEQSKTGMDDLD